MKVVCYVRGLDYRFSYKICRNCFWICREGLKSHNLNLSNCCKNALAIIHMPSSENNSYEFKNLAGTWFVPLVIYFDFESFLRPVFACKGQSDKSFTQVKEIHEPCGFCANSDRSPHIKANLSSCRQFSCSHDKFCQMASQTSQRYLSAEKEAPFIQKR